MWMCVISVDVHNYIIYLASRLRCFSSFSSPSFSISSFVSFTIKSYLYLLLIISSNSSIDVLLREDDVIQLYLYIQDETISNSSWSINSSSLITKPQTLTTWLTRRHLLYCMNHVADSSLYSWTLKFLSNLANLKAFQKSILMKSLLSSNAPPPLLNLI